MILQNPIDDQGATSVESLLKGATNDETLRTTCLEGPKISFVAAKIGESPAGRRTFVGFLISAATKYIGSRGSLSDILHLPVGGSAFSLQKHFYKQGVHGA